MTRVQFILNLTERLDKLPKADQEKALQYYLELIDDRIDDGVPEEEAVAAVGSLDEIAEQILSDVPHPTFPIVTLPKKNLKLWILILVIAGSPIWISILAVLFGILASIFAGIISLFASSVALGVSAPIALLLGVQAMVSQGVTVALVYWGLALVCAGLAIFFWIGGRYAVKFCIWACKNTYRLIQSLFLRKEDFK